MTTIRRADKTENKRDRSCKATVQQHKIDAWNSVVSQFGSIGLMSDFHSNAEVFRISGLIFEFWKVQDSGYYEVIHKYGQGIVTTRRQSY